MAPANDFVDVNCVFSPRKIGLRATANERTAHLYGLRVGDTLRDVLILLKGDQKLIDEIWGNYDAVVKDGIVFAGAKIVTGLRQGDAANACIRAAAVFKVVADREPVVGRKVVSGANRIL
jgi:hypothetical protein